MLANPGLPATSFVDGGGREAEGGTRRNGQVGWAGGLQMDLRPDLYHEAGGKRMKTAASAVKN